MAEVAPPGRQVLYSHQNNNQNKKKITTELKNNYQIVFLH